MGLRQAAALLLLGGLVLAFPGRALALEAEEERQGIYEESGAGELYGVLDPETRPCWEKREWKREPWRQARAQMG